MAVTVADCAFAPDARINPAHTANPPRQQPDITRNIAAENALKSEGWQNCYFCGHLNTTAKSHRKENSIWLCSCSFAKLPALAETAVAMYILVKSF
jgi:hypothetical protein